MSQIPSQVGQSQIVTPTQTQQTEQTTPAVQLPPIEGVTTAAAESPVAGSDTTHPLIGTEPTRVNISGMQNTENEGLAENTGFPVLHGDLADEAELVATALSYGTALLTESPAGSEEAGDTQRRIGEHIGGFLEMKELLTDDIKAKMPEMETEIDSMIETLMERTGYLQELKSSDPTTKSAMAQNKKDWVTALIDHFEQWFTQNALLADISFGSDPNEHIAMKLAELGPMKGLVDQLKERANKLADVKDDSPAAVKSDATDDTDKALEKAYADGIQRTMGQKKAKKSDVATAKDALKQQVLTQGTIPEDNGILSEAQVMEVVAKAVAEKLGHDPKEVSHQLEEAHQEVLGRQMHGFTKTIAVTTPQGTANYQSEMTPAKEFSGAIGHDYGDVGIPCHTSTANAHTKNLWSSELKNSDGRTLLSGLRHGVHSAYGFAVRSLRKEPEAKVQQFVKDLCPPELMVRDASGNLDTKATAKSATSLFSIRGMRIRNAMRGKANENRALETLAAAIQRNPSVMAQLEAGNTDIDPVQLNSISLLTPDALRAKPGFFGFGTEANERRMLKEQTSAFKAASAKPVPVTFTDANGNEVKTEVKVNVRTFNFGVNKGAVKKGIQFIAPSWGHANSTVNNEAMKSFIGENKTGDFGGDVEKFLARTDIETQTRREVTQLATQVRTIWNNGDYGKNTPDPYAMTSRLVLLSDRMGASTAWNCKSGKDRTGELDAEAKFLAIRMDQTGQVPEPGKLEEPDKRLFRTVALSSGNHEIQQQNTGGGGYKLEGVRAITDRLGSMQAKLVHRGQSKFTAS